MANYTEPHKTRERQISYTSFTQKLFRRKPIDTIVSNHKASIPPAPSEISHNPSIISYVSATTITESTYAPHGVRQSNSNVNPFATTHGTGRHPHHPSSSHNRNSTQPISNMLNDTPATQRIKEAHRQEEQLQQHQHQQQPPRAPSTLTTTATDKFQLVNTGPVSLRRVLGTLDIIAFGLGSFKAFANLTTLSLLRGDKHTAQFYYDKAAKLDPNNESLAALHTSLTQVSQRFDFPTDWSATYPNDLSSKKTQ